MAAKVTIADVARRAGVSTATVSRALKQPDRVSEATRERVQAAIDAVDYVPNSLGRNLRTQRTGTVVLVVRDIGNPFYLEIFRGVEAAARERGLSVLMGHTENDAERERWYFDMVRERRADGLILMTGKLPPGFRVTARSTRVPIVVALEYLEDVRLPTVRIDNVAAAREATAYLAGLGHRRIAHVSGPTPELMSRDRLDGYRAGLADAGLAGDEALIVRGDYSMAAGREATARLLALEPPPTAVFCANDEMAMGVIAAAREAGVEVPAGLSVVGFDDIVFARNFSPPLTTVAQPRQEIGQRALELLAAQLAGEPVGVADEVMPTRIVPRASTAELVTSKT
ncbi:LacI family DNA-binding transcriptional regulator [Arhodomonas sp. AD133]|uniref:LacI family DNA-binding transcriptional regulator n=1 Tax=Arhodomonas sp. AD133 TaxID=3415009 RepID=UPI003EB74017